MEIKNSLLKNLDPYRARIEAKPDAGGARVKGTEEHAAAAAASGDRVSLSPNARLLTAAHAETSTVPEVRQEKVNALKTRVADGDYTINSRNIAEKLVENELLLAGTLAHV
jgi:negative regulator of flagellin synthesis FlgM